MSYAAPSSGYGSEGGREDSYTQPKSPSSYSSLDRHQGAYYAPESLGGYAAPAAPFSYAPKVQRYPTSSAHGNSGGYGSNGYSPDAYGKTYGTVTQKEYSKTVETYGSSAGHGGYARAALHPDQSLEVYGRRNDRQEQPVQVESEDKAIYGYGDLY